MTPDQIKELYQTGKISLAQARDLLGEWVVEGTDPLARLKGMLSSDFSRLNKS